MLCLAPIFSKGGQQLLCRAQLFFFFFFSSQEKKEQNTKRNKNHFCFCSLTSLSKTISVAGGRFSLLRTFNFTIIHTRPVSTPFISAWMLDYIHRYTKKRKKNMKIKVIVIDICTACLTFCTEKTKHHFFTQITTTVSDSNSQ